MLDRRPPNLIMDRNLVEYFQKSVASAMARQNTEAGEDTVYYVVRLLASFARAEQLFETTPDGPMIRPLAGYYADAVHAQSAEERDVALQRLGDVALFVAGIFSNALNHKAVDVDYYVAMGGGAYSSLSMTIRGSARAVLADIFSELSDKFLSFVDVLGEVGERAPAANTDILRLYEVWIRTGSKRAERRLRALGFQPALNSISRAHH